LDAAKAANNKIKMKAIVDQQKKYIEEVEDDLKNRFSSLKSSIDNLLDVYTNAIHRRIEEPGYLLNVVISPSGQTELKALWQEKIAEIKQQSYEKLLKKLNNEKIMGLEALTSELQVEIEREEDERRRYRSLGYNKFISDENKGFYEIKKYLNDKLPKGLKNEFVYKYFVGGEEIIEDAIINVDDFDKEIVVYLYKEGEGKIAGEPIRTIEIEDMEDAKDLVDRIDRGMESKKYIDLDREYEKYTNNLYNFLETFITKTKDSKNMIHILGYDFYTKYENKKNLKKLVDYIIDEILNNREKYDREINLLNSQISDKALVNLFLKYFVPKFEKYEREEELKSKKEKESKTKNENESFISLSEYKKLYE